MKVEILVDTAAEGVVLNAGQVVEVSDANAKTLKLFGLAKDYVETIEDEANADDADAESKPKKGKK